MGITQRTGARFALTLAVGIAVGRIGCYFAGMDDFTFETPTTLPWGHDFGDGVARHPVQLYESFAMAGFAIFYLAAVAPLIVIGLLVGFGGIMLIRSAIRGPQP
jgi:prolipoprotein diacylglyceryltransferase